MAKKKLMDRALRGANQLFARYRYECYRRNHFFDLSREQFDLLVGSDCAYCGRPPKQVIYGFFYNGIDRVDNRKGYTRKNCVTACSSCNMIKGQHLTFDEMVVAMRAILHLRKGQGRRKGLPRSKG
jgi:5-methylcytosine-specific restriction endonuclease McrA